MVDVTELEVGVVVDVEVVLAVVDEEAEEVAAVVVVSVDPIVPTVVGTVDAVVGMDVVVASDPTVIVMAELTDSFAESLTVRVMG